MKIVVTHVFGWANKGDWALLEALLDSLLEGYPDADVVGICRDPEGQSKRFPNVRWLPQYGRSDRSGIFRRIENCLGILKGTLAGVGIRRWRLGSCWKDDRILRLQEADLIVACPGGYFEDSNFSIITNLLHLWLGTHSMASIVLAPQSLGPFRRKLVVRLARALLHKTALVCVREDSSYQVATKQLGLPASKVRLSPDMALYEQDCDDKLLGRVLPSLGISGKYISSTAIEWNFPFQSDMPVARERYMANLVGALQRLSAQLQAKIVMLRQIESAPGIVGDGPLLAELKRRAGHCIVTCDEDLPPRGMRALIAGASLHIGSRMHSNIFALQVGTPFVAISYLPKTQGIMTMVGLSEFVVDIATMQTEELVGLATKALAHPSKFEAARVEAARLGASGRKEFLQCLAQLSPVENNRI